MLPTEWDGLGLKGRRGVFFDFVGRGPNSRPALTQGDDMVRKAEGSRHVYSQRSRALRPETQASA
jgi:hypothetical protein